MNSFWRSGFSGPVYNPIDLFSSTVYDKGGWVQHMLRHVVGDTNFFNAMRDWYANHKDGNGNTAQYMGTQEARYGATLDVFFQQWVYGTGQPRYEFGWTSANLGNGTYRNYVRIRQTQTTAGVFTMPVDLTLYYPGGANELRTVLNNQLDQDFVLDTTLPLAALALDDQDWILKEARTVITLADADADGVPEAMGLVTNRLDLDAELVALAYRYRWAVELFFRWVKCVLGCRHLLSQTANGVRMQVYVALIASLLISLWVGRTPTKRTYEMLCFYLSGWATETELIAHLERLPQKAPPPCKN